MHVVSRPVAAVRRAVRHLAGRHSLQISLGSAVSGAWLWSVDCVCLRENRSRFQGRGDTRDTALAAARELVRDVDEVTAVKHVFGAPAVIRFWGETSLWVQAGQLALPEHLRGRGNVLTVGTGRRPDNGRPVGWAALTDAGWHQKGSDDLGGTWPVRALLALAVGRGLQFYPPGHVVDVVVDNLDVAHMARRILAGRVTSWLDAPSWLSREAFVALHKAANRRLRVRVIEIDRRDDYPLHAVAKRLAEHMPVTDLLRPKENE
ncbi:hypothetical protein SAMN04488074_105129 [Lentzea albidocapillata subsp. violacea]|uniref:Uncharacterized protein n=1 Tax=Lentzea albidocapillata subsp. violacea TaxID=128104 RepID=A0A1G9AVC8_9PSEU|nr:hypothetical protein [Lentzea albidocapillata]SDK31178.1 hypothetical protein SAMN04488074_105129 [Lentzea albidocapillata subsp. violacea]